MNRIQYNTIEYNIFPKKDYTNYPKYKQISHNKSNYNISKYNKNIPKSHKYIIK